MHAVVRLALLLTTAAVVLTISAAKAPPHPIPGHSPQSHPEHVRTVEQIVAAFYETVSGPKGQTRDWDRYRDLFFPEARLSVARSAHGTGVVSSFTIDEYVKSESSYIEKSGYFERAASMKVQRFGQIAHVLSVYESRRAAEDEMPYSRGVNSIQLVESGGRWWISSVLWQRETEDLSIPEEFLRQ